MGVSKLHMGYGFHNMPTYNLYISCYNIGINHWIKTPKKSLWVKKHSSTTRVLLIIEYFMFIRYGRKNGDNK